MLNNLFKKRPNLYLSRSDYYDSIISENSFIETLFAREGSSNESKFNTDLDILFYNRVPINSTLQQIISEIGDPNYIINKNEKLNHKVLLYKKNIATYRVRYELHLIDDLLIIGFKTFDVSSKTRKLKIIDTLNTKYGVNLSNSDLNNLRIVDLKKNHIRIIDTVNITLVYGIDNSFTFDLLRTISDNRESLKAAQLKKEAKQLMDNV